MSINVAFQLMHVSSTNYFFSITLVNAPVISDSFATGDDIGEARALSANVSRLLQFRFNGGEATLPGADDMAIRYSLDFISNR